MIFYFVIFASVLVLSAEPSDAIFLLHDGDDDDDDDDYEFNDYNYEFNDDDSHYSDATVQAANSSR
jgi:hypothetical protein